MNAKLLVSETIKRETFEIEKDDGEKIIYISILNEKGKEIDCEMKNLDGEPIDDPVLYEQIGEVLDSLK